MKDFKIILTVSIVILGVLSACSSPKTTGITDITWAWERFEDTAEMNNIAVDDPSMYTLLLKSDGQYEVKADCNLAKGQYTLEGSSLTLEPGLTTRVACEPDSLSDKYLAQLVGVVTFVMDGDNLVLNLMADSGNMVFIQAEE
jgi:heat shock protein HslJ